ncbi:hypothetical protein HYV21_00365 [Candidatus Microgenomates bacterium]|nr:hypothetical protein [Candidatus Microgenomates bacterium]
MQRVRAISKLSAKDGFAPILVLVAAFILATIVSGAYFYLSKTKPYPTPAPVSKSPSPTPGETADWKTYKGNGFFFRYPEYMSIESETANRTNWKAEFLPGSFSSNAMILDSQITPFLEPKINDFIVSIDESKTIALGGKDAKSYIYQCGPGPDCYVRIVYFDYQGIYYELKFDIAGGGLNRTADQILSTFQFLE